jgi:exodeoxyribonuclease VII small subunit
LYLSAIATSFTSFSFDKALKKIEEIDKWFEGNEHDLDTALKKYKEASGLIAECKKHLTRVEKVVAEDIPF